MRDGAPDETSAGAGGPPGAAGPDAERTRDAQLVRSVRWRLVLFSGGATLAVLLLLGVAIYTAVSSSLTNQGIDQLNERAQPIVQWVKSGGAGPALANQRRQTTARRQRHPHPHGAGGHASAGALELVDPGLARSPAAADRVGPAP